MTPHTVLAEFAQISLQIQSSPKEIIEEKMDIHETDFALWDSEQQYR